jgi:hypothetical protein
VLLQEVRLPDGPPAVASWRDRFAVAGPPRRGVLREGASVHGVTCAFDSGLDVARKATPHPVFGVMRCAGATALARRAARFGVIGSANASLPRNCRALHAMRGKGKGDGDRSARLWKP